MSWGDDVLNGVGENPGGGGLLPPVPPFDHAEVHPLQKAVVNALMSAETARLARKGFARLPPVRVQGPIAAHDFVTLFNYYDGVTVVPKEN